MRGKELDQREGVQVGKFSLYLILSITNYSLRIMCICTLPCAWPRTEGREGVGQNLAIQ